MFETIAQWGILFAFWYGLHILAKSVKVALKGSDKNDKNY